MQRACSDASPFLVFNQCTIVCSGILRPRPHLQSYRARSGKIFISPNHVNMALARPNLSTAKQNNCCLRIQCYASCKIIRSLHDTTHSYVVSFIWGWFSYYQCSKRRCCVVILYPGCGGVLSCRHSCVPIHCKTFVTLRHIATSRQPHSAAWRTRPRSPA